MNISYELSKIGFLACAKYYFPILMTCVLIRICIDLYIFCRIFVYIFFIFSNFFLIINGRQRFFFLSSPLTDITGQTHANVLLPISVKTAESVRRTVILLVTGYCKSSFRFCQQKYDDQQFLLHAVYYIWKTFYHAERDNSLDLFLRNQTYRYT